MAIHNKKLKCLLRDNINVINIPSIQRIVMLAKQNTQQKKEIQQSKILQDVMYNPYHHAISSSVYDSYRNWTYEFLENCIYSIHAYDPTNYDIPTLNSTDLIAHNFYSETIYPKIISKIGFYNLIREIVQDVATNEKVNKDGVEILKQYWIDESVKLFEKVFIITRNAGRLLVTNDDFNMAINPNK